MIAVQMGGGVAMMMLGNGAMIAGAAVHCAGGPGGSCQRREKRGDRQQASPCGEEAKASLWRVDHRRIKVT